MGARLPTCSQFCLADSGSTRDFVCAADRLILLCCDENSFFLLGAYSMLLCKTTRFLNLW